MSLSNAKRVLLVDDDPNALSIHATWLGLHGYAVLEADSGEPAVAIARRESPDLVILDLKMPGVDGWHAMEILREDPATRHLFIVALTIIAPGEDRRDPLRRGFDAHWVKPLTHQALIEQVEGLIGPAVE